MRITAHRAEGGVLVSIGDSGCGITEQQMKHIFEKFYQADLSHSTKGNGLGLALVKEILSLVGADITVESTVGQGSVFSVLLK